MATRVVWVVNRLPTILARAGQDLSLQFQFSLEIEMSLRLN